MCLSYPAQVIEVAADGTALVAGAGPARRVPLVVITSAGQRVQAGDWLLVHSGLAVARISPDEAASARALLEEAMSYEGSTGDTEPSRNAG
jgi:hydrogenase expression/formation protein HypC